MGPFDDIGPYAETVITTRKTDVNAKPDNEPGFCHVLIGLLLLFPGLWVVAFMGLFLWAYIGPITAIGIIGLSFCACARYGTNHSILDLFRYRTAIANRKRIARRLSDVKKSEKKTL